TSALLFHEADVYALRTARVIVAGRRAGVGDECFLGAVAVRCRELVAHFAPLLRRDSLFAVFVLTASALQAAPISNRPNILFALADDWGRYASIYRDPAHTSLSDVIDTPNVDRVGREGVVFRNAFVAAPSCTPSRAAMTSGMYFYRNGREANLYM